MLHTIAYFSYAIAQGALAIWALRLVARDRSLTAWAVLAPVAAVVWDNGIIAAGSFIGEGLLLEALTFPRFLGHALFTPSWIIAATGLAIRAGAFSRHSRKVFKASIALYFVMVAIGLMNEVFFYRGELVTEGDVLYYTNIGRLLTPPPPSLTMTLVVFVMGLMLLRYRWPWMALSPVVMVVFQALGGEGLVFIFINSAEVLMSASMIATLVWVRSREARDAAPATEPMRLVSDFVD